MKSSGIDLKVMSKGRIFQAYQGIILLIVYYDISTGVFMKKWDLLIAVFFVIVAIISYIILNMTIGDNGNYAEVTVNGQHYATLNLHENKEIVITSKGSNILVISDGEAYMKDADCPDKICVHQGHISKTSQTIVCLPNKVVIKIVGNHDNIDAYAQ